MSEDGNEKDLDPTQKVQRLPTDVADWVDRIRRVLRVADQQECGDSPTSEPASGQHAARGESDQSLNPAAADEAQGQHEAIRTPGTRPARVAKSNSAPADNASTIVESMIGLSFMFVGLATLIVVGLLPHRPAAWIFDVAALIVLIAGAMRIDRSTRRHRKSRRRDRSGGTGA